MRRLKIILLFKVLCFILLCFGFINVLYHYNKYPSSIYNGESISGEVISCSLKEDKVKVIIKGLENVLVYIDKPFKCVYGAYIKAYGEIDIPPENRMPHLFNYRKYLLSLGVYRVFYASDVSVLGVNKIYFIKNALYDYLSSFKSSDYMQAFILGDKSFMDSDVLNSYQANGLSYLFAISGMNITILSGILLFILGFFFSKGKSYFFVCLFLLFYIFLTGFLPSIIRASLFFILITLNKYTGFKINSIYILLFILSILLIFNPCYVFNMGFVLSFVVTFYLILFSTLINRFDGYFKKTFTISLISFFASFPVIVSNFYHVNFLSPFLSVIFTPLVLMIIYPLVLICFVFKPFDFILDYVTSFLESLSFKVSFFDFFDISFPYISFFILFYFFIVYFVLKKCVLKKYYYLFILVFVFIFHHFVYDFDARLKVSFLNVGQGDSTFIKMGGKNILIDTGGSFMNKNYSLVLNETIPYLRASGAYKIDYLILTHGDYDHMGEAINLVNNFKVEKVIFNCGEYNDLEKKLIKVLDKKKIKYYSCIKKLNIDNNKLYFLQTKEYENENDNSNVIYTELNGYKFMFMGDAGVEKEKDILDKYNLSNIDVLKVGHHGSKTSSSKEFINEINPNYSIISVGKNNRYGHPNKKVLDNLKDTKIYRTDQDGSIMFKIKNNKLKIETCSP